MPLTRLDNLISSKTGRYLYVSPDDFNASDALDNRGNSPTRPFLTIQRAFLEVARYSYVPAGNSNNPDNDRFDQFTIMLSPGNHYVDNRPGEIDTSAITAFNFDNGEWNDSSILDLSNPNNILRKFNSVEGGAIIPRGTSLVGADLRRTQVRPLYVPDPADKDVARTSIFQVTGGCYFWQFTILDGDSSSNSPLYNSSEQIGKVYAHPSDTTNLAKPFYSHHKITNFVFARKNDLGLLYQKVAKAFSEYQPEINQPGEFNYRIQENRIVGPLTDSNQIESITVNNISVGTDSYVKVTVETKVPHLFFVGQYVAVTNLKINDKLNGVFYVQGISTTDSKQFYYYVDGTAAGLGLVDGQVVTDAASINKTGAIATVQAEVDSVESASPYVFNVSIRSTWGICGIWADGSRASGFKSMVIAQYTGVSLQKDDRAFIRYDELTNTWNQASLDDAFSTTPYHIDSAAYWKDDWRNFHVRASEDSFIQCVSIFAVGFADHFLMESGGDMSITNSNSNFGNTSLHTKGFKGFAFNQDKGGYVSDIIPPKKLDASTPSQETYYPFNISLTKQIANQNRLYLSPTVPNNPDNRPSSTISGFKFGGRSGEKIYVKLDAITGEVGKQLKSAIVNPSGVKKWRSTLSTLSPTIAGVNNKALDAANLISANKTFIQEEAFGYILQKYPYLQDRPYVNPNITGDTGRYRDASSLIKANRQEIIDTAYNQLVTAYPSFTNPSITKCKRDMGYVIDAIANDLYSGGNSYIVDATKAYFGAYSTISSVAREDIVSNGISTIYGIVTTTQPHNLKVGDTIAVSNCSVTGFDNPSAIVTSVPSATQFKYVNGTASLISTVATGTVTGPNNVPINNGLVGEEVQSVYAFNAVRDLAKLAINNQLTVKDLTITADPATTSNTDINSCSNVKSTIDTLTSIMTTAISAGNLNSLPVRNSGPWSTVSENSKCKRDIGYIVEAIASDLQTGGNQNVINAAKAYYIGTSGISSTTPLGPLNYIENEKPETLDAYAYVRDLTIAAMRNWIFTKTGCSTSTSTGNVTIGGVSYQAGTIAGVGSTVGMVVGMKVVGPGIPANTYIKKIVSATQIQLGSAASRLDVGNSVLASSSQSNVTFKFGLVAAKSTIKTASRTGSTATITTTLPHDFITGDIVDITCSSNSAYTKTSVSITVTGTTTFTYTTTGTGTIASASQTGTVVESVYSTPAWSISTTPKTDLSVIKDTAYPECSDVASAISTYYDLVYTILNTPNGINSVTINAGTSVDTTALAKRATLFTLTEVGTSNNNPHTLETGTPVKLVPTALDSSVDPRVVRLPKGFSPDTKYYVIAPGRYTQPYDYSTGVSATFNGSNEQVLMLATSVENANAGIYIYSSETSSIDPGVVIEVHQHVKDINYDLMKYKTKMVSSTIFQTEGAHSFDVPLTSLVDSETGLPQKVFFRVGTDISGSSLPPFDSTYASGSLPKDQEYYVRYVKPSSSLVTALNTQFTIHTSLTDAKNGTNPARFTPNFTPEFYTYSNKRRAPIKFDPQLTPKPIPVVISTVARSNGSPKIATITTSTAHGLANGDVVTINCTSDTSFNASAVQVTIQNLSTTTFSYTNDTGSAILTPIAATGTVTKVTSVTTSTTTTQPSYGGCWYIKTSANNNTIYDRFVIISANTSSDTYFERISDDRASSDKIYRLRYVIPKDGNYREPINGFVLKLRTDDTRKLLPQKILLKPVNSASVDFANVTHNSERLGLSITEQINGSAYNTANPTFISTYDPYVDPHILTSLSKIDCKVQSAKKVLVGNKNYLQLTVFDIGISDPAYKNDIFTVVKITTPQGGTGNFVQGTTITWSGYSSGSATLHACYTGSGSTFQNQNYLILKNPTATIEYSAFNTTTFAQGLVSAVLVEEPDGGRSNKSKYLYTTDGASIYTLAPGDTFTLPLTSGGTADYYIDSISDVDDLQNTYYIFKSETIRKRVKGQQDGIYYLTCLRGDIKPYPTGSGIDNNFREFKFSQPVSRVYPLNYTNDPLWFQITDNVINTEDPSRDTTIQDPPASVSAADNYVHGYVTINDARQSITKESVNTLIVDPGTGNHTFNGVNILTAQEGSASAGSESRKIPISGNSDYPTENKLYVELRRPSIARSGNHTFEYLGFGPGNYSTSFPARQQVVLTDIQDYYAQAKKEDAGIVLYTGLNSSGDLYIGNLKINAVTGEQTYLDAPITDEVDSEASIAGTLVTTFDDPVTFNNNVLFQKPPGTEAAIVFNTPVLIDSSSQSPAGDFYASPLVIKNYPVTSGQNNDPKYNGSGNIIFENNIATFGVWRINPRGTQAYSIRTSDNNSLPPSGGAMVDLTGNSLANFSGQPSITWGSIPPKSGDVVFKGGTTEQSGSLGWILANTLSQLSTTGSSPQITGGKTFLGYAILRLSFGQTIGSLGITSASQFKITNASLTDLNTTSYYWSVLTSLPGTVISSDSAINGGSYAGPQTSHTYIYLQIGIAQASTQTWISSSLGNVYLLKNTWKEFGVIGSEALRTNTDKWGDFRLGINTIARAAHSAYSDSFISSQGQNTEINPRANLDLVGTAFISGKTIRSFLTNTTTTKTLTSEDNAFVVGGDSATPGTSAATLRLATSDNTTPDGAGYQTGGRIGINTVLTDLDRNLVIKGNARITGDFKFENDIDINGGGLTNTADVRTSITSGTFNLLANSGFIGTLNIGSYSQTVNAFNRATSLSIADTITNATDINVATSSTNSSITIGNSSTNATNVSDVSIGGAYLNNETNSITQIKTKSTKIWGDLNIGSNKSFVNTLNVTTNAGTVNFFSGSGSASTLNFATNAAIITLGAQGGTTEIRNSLTVDASIKGKGNITLNGGTASFTFDGARASLGSTIAAHYGSSVGIPGDKNIDIVTVLSTADNAVNTAGSGDWGGTFFQNAINTYQSDSGAALAALTGNQYYLPLASIPTYAEGDDLIINTTVASGRAPEIVKVAPGGLVRIATAPYYIIVLRQPYGTFLPIKTTHPDNTVVKKINVSLDATWLTASVVGTGSNTNFTLAEFGGSLNLGDYLFVDRNSEANFAINAATGTGSTATLTFTAQSYVPFFIGQQITVSNVVPSAYNGTFTVTAATQSTVSYASTATGALTSSNATVSAPFGNFGEAVKVGVSSNATPKAFIIDNGSSTPVTKFYVDSTTGATTISDSTSLGGLKVYGPLQFYAGCGSASTKYFKLNDDAATPITHFSVDMCTGDTIIGAGSSGGSLTIGSDFTIKTGISGSTKLTVSASTGDTVLSSTTSSTSSTTGALKVAGGVGIVENLNVGADITLSGGDLTVNSGSTKRFKVNATGTIDLGGIDTYFTATGGRKWVYISTSSNNQNTAELLSSNVNYYVTPTGTSSQLILLLPTSPSNGDMIRIVDIGGNISYNCQLIIRAQSNQTIQGDSTGTNIGMSSGTYSGGGELIINTPNVGLGLVYVGTTDGNGTTIPSLARGWRLMEV